MWLCKNILPTALVGVHLLCWIASYGSLDKLFYSLKTNGACSSRSKKLCFGIHSLKLVTDINFSFVFSGILITDVQGSLENKAVVFYMNS